MAFTASHLFFDDLQVGQEWTSASRTVTSADIVNFAGVSGDFNSIHVDHEFAKSTPFRQPIAHGLLVFSIASGLGLYAPAVRTLAFMSIKEWHFREPVFAGDTVCSWAKVVARRARRGRQGIVTWERKVVNQSDKVVQEGNFADARRGSRNLAKKRQKEQRRLVRDRLRRRSARLRFVDRSVQSLFRHSSRAAVSWASATPIRPEPHGVPSHIGGVRTALFNWLLTRRLGGQFVLRIDDTDAKRNIAEALQPILDGFRWLGIFWDEGPEVGGDHGPYFQSQRLQLYVDAARKLIDSGHAYPCYASKEELDVARKEAEKAKRNYVHRGANRTTSPAENRRLYDLAPASVRLKIPEGRAIAIDDKIRGHVEWQSDLIGDPVILRPDGRALYNFATVVDDIGVGITHVIRAAEHLTNTAIQVACYEALEAPHADVRLMFPSSTSRTRTKKLSKRTNMKKFVTPEIRETNFGSSAGPTRRSTPATT